MIFTGSGNANRISGIPVQSGIPTDTFTLNYDAASRRWIFAASGSPPAGGVGGASNLTTAGWVPYVTSAGVLTGEVNLFWDATNDRLGVGTNAPQSQLSLSGVSGHGLALVNTTGFGGVSRIDFFGLNSLSNVRRFAAIQGVVTGEDIANGEIGAITFSTKPNVGDTALTERARFTSTGNLLLNTITDDGTHRLQVAGNARLFAAGPKLIMRDTAIGTADFSLLASGNVIAINREGQATLGRLNFVTGEFIWSNETPTTGSTSLVVRAGEGQSGNLTTWQNSAGAQVARVASDGGIDAFSYVRGTDFGVNSVAVLFKNSMLMQFSSTSSFSGVADLGLARNAAGILEVNSGAAGTFRDLRLRNLIGDLTTPASAAAAGVQGTVVWDANFIYICTATNTWKRVAIATW